MKKILTLLVIISSFIILSCNSASGDKVSSSEPSEENIVPEIEKKEESNEELIENGKLRVKNGKGEYVIIEYICGDDVECEDINRHRLEKVIKYSVAIGKGRMKYELTYIPVLVFISSIEEKGEVTEIGILVKFRAKNGYNVDIEGSVIADIKIDQGNELIDFVSY